jgi:hypothetical protein
MDSANAEIEAAAAASMRNLVGALSPPIFECQGCQAYRELR